MSLDAARALDPEVADAFRRLSIPLRPDDWDVADIPAMRAERLARAQASPPTGLPVRHEDISVSDAVSVRVVRPESQSTDLPCLFWIHGGGFLFGTAHMVEPWLDRWVHLLDCVAVSVEYRLSPEHPYPQPLEDCQAALEWVAVNAAELRIVPSRIVVGGRSAGSSLASALALLNRDLTKIPLAFQLLIYPCLDDQMTTPSSQWMDVPIWNRETNILGWQCYLGDLYGRVDVPPYAAAARATDLSGLPPAFVSVGALDVFHDECVEYAGRLQAAGVPTELQVYPGAPHGFDAFAPESAVAVAALADIENALSAALHPE